MIIKDFYGFNKMRAISSAMAFLMFSGLSFAGPAVQLSPMEGENSIDDHVTKNFTGSCGDAIVRVLGVTYIGDDQFRIDLDAGMVVVRNTRGNELFLNINNVLQDYNGVSCINTKNKGGQLLVWTNCGGSACSEGYNYYVIDPATATIVAPKDPTKETCDAQCASEILEDYFPIKLDKDFHS